MKPFVSLHGRPRIFFHPSYVSKKDYFDGVFKQNGRRLPMQANHHFAKAYPQCELLNKSNSFCSRSFRIRKPHNKESLLEIRKFPHTDGFFSLLRWRLLKICETILSLVRCRFRKKDRCQLFEGDFAVPRDLCTFFTLDDVYSHY